MDQAKAKAAFSVEPRARAVEYLFDMIDQLAALARKLGEIDVAIHLEAVTAARRAIAKDQSP